MAAWEQLNPRRLNFRTHCHEVARYFTNYRIPAAGAARSPRLEAITISAAVIDIRDGIRDRIELSGMSGSY
jgi:hypothetical protein